MQQMEIVKIKKTSAQLHNLFKSEWSNCNLKIQDFQTELKNEETQSVFV
jgi:hypothetical protein